MITVKHSDAAARKITVATWNVGGCRIDVDGDDREDVSYFADTVRSVAPDFLFLQEVHVFDNGAANQGDLLGAKLGYPFVYVHAGSNSHLAPDAQLALGILSRHPISKLEYSVLPTPDLTAQKGGETWRLFPKGVLTGTAELPGLTLELLCAHTHPFHHFGRDALDPELAKSWTFLDRRLAALAEQQLVAGIDLNDERYEALLSLSLGRGVQNVFREPTTPKGVQQDYVMYAGSRLAIEDWVVQPTRADHHLCVTRFSIRAAD